MVHIPSESADISYEEMKKMKQQVNRSTNSFCPPQGIFSKVITDGVTLIVLWILLWSLMGQDVLPGGNLFGLIVIFYSAFLGGKVLEVIRIPVVPPLPPLIGMLLAGFTIRNVPILYELVHIPTTWSSILRNTALTIILIRAGLGLDPQENGYGVDKGIPTLLVAASSMDDIAAITGFNTFLSIVFSSVWETNKTWGQVEKALGLQLHSCCPVSEMTCSERLGRSIVAKVKKPEGTILTLDVLTVKVREHSSCPPEDASSMELLGNDEDDTATEELGRKHSRKIRSQNSKNKRLTKGGKKGAKKKVVGPFSKKDWYDVKAPAMFNIRNIGKTLVARTQGTKIASDGLKGHVFEVSLADLQNDEVAFRKFKLITEDIQGKN
ncbi:hypothetical protein U0070_025415 [Myodes glareolus]|uniref:Uncharacterized protein n=1 Tax=Myodes glareolus TaxID=447135 RepID=A0AAW0IYE8_MYOGA